LGALGMLRRWRIPVQQDSARNLRHGTLPITVSSKFDAGGVGVAGTLCWQRLSGGGKNSGEMPVRGLPLPDSSARNRPSSELLFMWRILVMERAEGWR